jgi:CRISPR/Cas system-associated exonuclease Cas4 (RecB family)
MSLKNIAKLVKQATATDMTPAKEFQNYLNQAITMLERKNTRPPSQTYKPSSLGGCMRKVFFEVTGAPIDPNPDVEPDFVGICESGTDRHERLQNAVIAMKELGIDCEWVDVEEYLRLYPQPGTELVQRKGNEFKLRNTILNMSFMCDGIIKFGGKYYILEIKTEASFKWNGRTDAEEKHKVQASSYSVALGIDDVMFVYEQRDFCKKKYIHVHVTAADKEEKVIHYINTCQDYVEREEVPPKTDKKSECNYCQFKVECKKW